MRIRSDDAKVASWAAALTLAATYGCRCGYPQIDLRRSTALVPVLRNKGIVQQSACTAVELVSSCCERAGCVPLSTPLKISPRWLARCVGFGGPLMTWIPLLLATAGNSDGGAWPSLRPTILWYLGAIGPVRHACRVLPSHWDPSGHIFVYGMQLLPLWAASPPMSPLSVYLTGWSACLCYLSVATAAFFHTASESAAGFALVAPLWLCMRTQSPTQRERRAERTKWPLATQQRKQTQEAAAQGNMHNAGHRRSAQRACARACMQAAPVGAVAAVWAGVTGAAWCSPQLRRSGVLAGELVYDASLFALFALGEVLHPRDTFSHRLNPQLSRMSQPQRRQGQQRQLPQPWPGEQEKLGRQWQRLHASCFG
uniref:Uncharacterized protein n=1 Tax=Chrysotila carterae TaxID=13221 RepID=A0A7S4C305_CHRCT